MDYYVQTKRLLDLYSDKNTNILRHFFSELQQFRGLYSIAIINAIIASQNENVRDEYDLIEISITRENYMKKISLVDIRNVIVFIVRKDCNKVIRTYPYIQSEETDEIYLSLNTPSTLGKNIKSLQTLIETCYYISHIFYITRTPSIIKKDEWKMCHDYFHDTPLPVSVKHIYTLLRKLLF